MSTTATNVNGPVTETENEPRLWWLIVARGPELDLRRRRTIGSWRMVCPVYGSHVLTFANGQPGLTLTCHGPGGDDSPGHSLAAHRNARAGVGAWNERFPDLHNFSFPCHWCGCTESQVLAALGARPRDKYRQAKAQRDGYCRCGTSGYRVARYPVLCLLHLVDRVGLERAVLFPSPERN